MELSAYSVTQSRNSSNQLLEDLYQILKFIKIYHTRWSLNKYILHFLSKNNKIDLLDKNELNEILYNLIFDIIDDSLELFTSF